MKGKIALEEHVSTQENNRLWDSKSEALRNGRNYMDNVEKRLLETELRLKDMDACGIRHAILSLTSPGAQSILDVAAATHFVTCTNDYIAEYFVQPHPDRFSASATVALQNPQAAADELERAVKKLGMKGALINGYTNMSGTEEGRYLDDPAVEVFWQKVSELNVPVYLHPREPLPAACGIYRGYESLVGSAWGFATETAVHAIRLMMSGLFDRYPNITIILGHLGEGLTFMLPRTAHRLEKQFEGIGLGGNQQPLTDYLTNNFYVTTSGHFTTSALHNAIEVMGKDRVMFSVDYPYEDMCQAADWFDPLVLDADVKQSIAYGNARRVFSLPE
ncbi:amidohydrolase [Serratia marcescens]|nr:amidohydrolase [Serratia marcescens]